MFERLTIKASEPDASRRGYTALTGGPELSPDLEIVAATGDEVTRGLHVALRASSPKEVDERWAAALAAGFADDGAPGRRPECTPAYYGGFTLDPDGNSAEAVHHEARHPAGRIDHVWIRVADIAAQRERFGPGVKSGSFRLKRDEPDWVMFAAPTGSISLRPAGDAETRNVHIAFANGFTIEI